MPLSLLVPIIRSIVTLSKTESEYTSYKRFYTRKGFCPLYEDLFRDEDVFKRLLHELIGANGYVDHNYTEHDAPNQKSNESHVQKDTEPYKFKSLYTTKFNPAIQNALSSKENTEQKKTVDETKTSVPDRYLKDGRLVVFSSDHKTVYTLYMDGQFLPVSEQDTDLQITMDDIVAVYEYPTSKINELFWKQKPEDELLDHPVWKEDQEKLQIEIDKLEDKLARLKNRRIK